MEGMELQVLLKSPFIINKENASPSHIFSPKAAAKNFLSMNQAHAEMLRSLGVTVDPADVLHSVTPPRSKSPVLPSQPHHYDQQGVAVFTTEQIKWADPAVFGFDQEYYVVEQEESAHPLALNYHDEILLPRKRPVHRYSRHERFRSILGQLMGCSGNVPKEVFQVLNAEHLRQLPRDQLWDTIRSILKLHNWRIYYNRIPAILAGLGMSDFKYGDTSKFQDILHDFSLMDKIFVTLKSSVGRSYFPNLRFVAIKLMKRHGIEPVVPIPLARTMRKLQGLEDLYNLIWKEIEDKQWNDFFSSLF